MRSELSRIASRWSIFYREHEHSLQSVGTRSEEMHRLLKIIRNHLAVLGELMDVGHWARYETQPQTIDSRVSSISLRLSQLTAY